VVVVVMVVVVMVVLRRIRWDSRSGKNGDTQKGKHPNAKLHGLSPVYRHRLMHRRQVIADYL
jgi:hypothetical protein